MKKFIIEESFFNVFPNAKIGVVICKGINNKKREELYYEEFLRNAEKGIDQYITHSQLSKNKVISVWREAYKKFKTKKGARSSIESLFKRVTKGNKLPSINPLVDLYNGVSLKYGLPCGGEDIDTFEGDLRLTKAIGDEVFVTFGSDKNIPPKADEIIYKDDAGAVCRCFNWRESVRTILTEDTQNAFLCIESIDPSRNDALEEALETLKNLIEIKLLGKCETFILEKTNTEIYI